MSNLNQPKVISYKSLQLTIGILGVSMPIILWLMSSIYYKAFFIHSTISHYYYSPAGDAFVIILSVLAIFLFSYVGYQDGGRGFISDNIITNISGLLAMLVVVFPTGYELEKERVLNKFTDPSISNHILNLYDHHAKNIMVSYTNIHNGAAILFILSLGYISYFHFTRSNAIVRAGSKKYKRNIIYKSCGIAVFIAVSSIILLFAVADHELSRVFPTYIFWLECVALVAFGISWLTKADCFYKD